MVDSEGRKEDEGGRREDMVGCSTGAQAESNRRKERGTSSLHSLLPQPRCTATSMRNTRSRAPADQTPSRAEANSLVASGSLLRCGAVEYTVS
jgi:hypothetical protein